LQCGNPSDPEVKAVWNREIGDNGWFAAPDNCVVSLANVLWVSTDQGSGWAETGTADGLHAIGTEGGRARLGQDVLPRARRCRALRPSLHAKTVRLCS